MPAEKQFSELSWPKAGQNIHDPMTEVTLFYVWVWLGHMRWLRFFNVIVGLFFACAPCLHYLGHLNHLSAQFQIVAWRHYALASAQRSYIIWKGSSSRHWPYRKKRTTGSDGQQFVRCSLKSLEFGLLVIARDSFNIRWLKSLHDPV